MNPYISIDYEKIGKTESGRAWVEKAIHPPGASKHPVRGMPDNESFPSTVVEFRNTTTIDPPIGQTTGTWNVLVLSLPGPETTALQWKWGSTQAPPTADMSVIANRPTPIRNPNYDFTQWANQTARWRRLLGSQTFELNAPSLSNQGMVYSAQQRLEVTSDPLQTTNQGTSTDKLTVPAQQVVLTTLPTQPNVLQQLSPGFYKQMAKEGCFTTSRLAQPMNLYQNGEDVVSMIGTRANLATSENLSIYTYSGRPVTRNFITANYDVGVSTNWSSCWTLFTGISLDATVELKTIHSYEVQASLGSSFSLFVEPSAEPDSQAVEAYYTICHGLQDAYPASYNFLGSLMAFLPRAISTIAGWLRPAAAAVAPLAGQAVTGALQRFATPPTRENIAPRVNNLDERPKTPRAVVNQPQAVPKPGRTMGKPRSRPRKRT